MISGRAIKIELIIDQDLEQLKAPPAFAKQAKSPSLFDRINAQPTNKATAPPSKTKPMYVVQVQLYWKRSC